MNDPTPRIRYNQACAHAALFSWSKEDRNKIAMVLAEIYGVQCDRIAKDLVAHAQIIEDLAKPYDAPLAKSA